jgi:hypothetical protein
VVPDSKAMNRAIKNHVAEHKQADYGLVPESLEEFLTEQILIVASEMNLPNVGLSKVLVRLRVMNRFLLGGAHRVITVKSSGDGSVSGEVVKNRLAVSFLIFYVGYLGNWKYIILCSVFSG